VVGCSGCLSEADGQPGNLATGGRGAENELAELKKRLVKTRTRQGTCTTDDTLARKGEVARRPERQGKDQSELPRKKKMATLEKNIRGPVGAGMWKGTTEEQAGAKKKN